MFTRIYLKKDSSERLNIKQNIKNMKNVIVCRKMETKFN